MKYLTRKNPYYLWGLIVFQFVFGVWLLNKQEQELFLGGFFLMCSGTNIGYALSGNPPDAI